VARLAGLPDSLLKKATFVLQGLDRERGGDISAIEADLEATIPKPDPLTQELLERLEACNPEKLTPLEALNYLMELRELVKGRL